MNSKYVVIRARMHAHLFLFSLFILSFFYFFFLSFVLFIINLRFKIFYFSFFSLSFSLLVCFLYDNNNNNNNKNKSFMFSLLNDLDFSKHSSFFFLLFFITVFTVYHCIILYLRSPLWFALATSLFFLILKYRRAFIITEKETHKRKYKCSSRNHICHLLI